MLAVDGHRSTLQPGALTALLAELARAPEPAGWDVPLLPGEVVGRFAIVRPIGRGGFGVVYEARDEVLGRSVALKAVRPAAAARDVRSMAEAEAAARLAHPNIVHLYDVGTCDRGPYLIMELLRGDTLAARLARGPLPLREAVRIAADVSRGVAHAHAERVVHRDLKPGNVFLCDDGQVKVLDFGMAHVFGHADVAGGTPAYMAPEQARGEVGDERADVYGLGVLVHELVTGKRPFEGAERGVPPGGKPPELAGAPAALAKLVAAMLACDPDARPRSAVEVHAALAAIQRAMEPRRLLWAAWSVAAVALVAAAGFAQRSRPLPPGRLLVAIADTENKTGDADLDGVGELLRAGLEQSRRVAVMARSRLVNSFREAGDPVPKVIGEAEARSAARAARAQLLVVPMVVRTGTGYDVTVRARDLMRDEPLFTVREPAPEKASVTTALDRLTSRLRAALREEAREAPRKPVSAAELAPADPVALRLYTEGKRFESEGRYAAALDAFERALAADPDFQLPRVEIVRNDGLWNRIGSESDFDRHLSALRRDLHRLTEKDRAAVEFVFAIVDGELGNYTEWLAGLDRAIEAAPEDPGAYVWAAHVLVNHRADADAARPYMEKALALAPLSPDVRQDFLVELGRLDEALAHARQWVEEAPSPASLDALSGVHRVRGDVPSALEAARRSVALGGRKIWAFVDADLLEEAERQPALRDQKGDLRATWLRIRGQVREALAAYDRGRPPPGAHRIDRLNFLGNRLYLTAQLGDPEPLWRGVTSQLREGFGPHPCMMALIAMIGDAERASTVGDPHGLMHDRHVCWRITQGLAIWKRGDREAALRAFARLPIATSQLFRGEILAELGRDREAVDAFRLSRHHVRNEWEGNFDPMLYPRSLYDEAAALERLGQREEASKVVGRLLHLWERADRRLPLLGEAKALRARLARPPGVP